MGLGAASLIGACDMQARDTPDSTAARGGGDALGVTQDGTPSARATRRAVGGPAASAPRTLRSLCGPELDQPRRGSPKIAVSRAAAAGTKNPPSELRLGEGKWTWLNFWATWCAPCREEIPRLIAWEQRLGAQLRVEFVSLDDDQRSLEHFLNGQPDGGLKFTFWLKDGKEREDWLRSAGVEPDPELPLHLLVDARGKVRCKIQGSVVDADFDEVQAIVARH